MVFVISSKCSAGWPRTPIPNWSRSGSAFRWLVDRGLFGMDLATPPRRTRGRFISQLGVQLGVSWTDDHHGVVLVAVPP